MPTTPPSFGTYRRKSRKTNKNPGFQLAANSFLPKGFATRLFFLWRGHPFVHHIWVDCVCTCHYFDMPTSSTTNCSGGGPSTPSAQKVPDWLVFLCCPLFFCSSKGFLSFLIRALPAVQPFSSLPLQLSAFICATSYALLWQSRCLQLRDKNIQFHLYFNVAADTEHRCWNEWTHSRYCQAEVARTADFALPFNSFHASPLHIWAFAPTTF